jgi:DedD protein
MSFFNFRRAGTNSAPNAGPNAPTESMEVIRKRAKHRLIGSAVLVLAGVVGFPLLFDTQPRPISVDIPIEIPGKNTVRPLGASALPSPASVAAPTPAPAAPVAAGPATDKVAAASSLSSKEEILTDKKAVPQAVHAPAAIKTEAKPAPKAELKPDPKPEVKPEIKQEAKPAPKPAAPTDDGARARALLNGQAASTSSASASAPTAAGAADARLIVQVGAFADADKAKEVRLKLEKAGLKTYTQVAETAGGKRIRVRVGPFGSKAEAEKAASKIKALDLPAAILTL